MFKDKKNNRLLCPYCGQSISKTTFNYKQALKKVNSTAIKMNKGQESLKADDVNPTQAYEACCTFSGDRPLFWSFYQNEVAAPLQELFEEVATIVSAYGIRPPKNAELPEGRKVICHVADEFWLWCLDYVYRKRVGKNAPRIQLAKDEQTQQDNLLFYDDKLQPIKHLLATNVSPVCPNPACRMILWNSVLEITDDPIRIVLLGDPSTGKTVWQVALTAFLEERRRIGKEPCYYISDHAKLILPQTLSWRMQARKEQFLSGIVPRQTPAEKQGAFANGGVYDGMTTEFSGFASDNTTGRQDEGRADALILILREETATGKLKSCRFVRITDVAGDDAIDHKIGFNDLGFLRSVDALFLFAYINEKNRTAGYVTPANSNEADGLKTVRRFMTDTQNKALPYFAVMFPKADEDYFRMRLYKTLLKTFNVVFTRILQFELESDTNETNKLRPLVKLFSEHYLHYSPEVLAGFVCSHFCDRLPETFTMATPEEYDALFEQLTQDPAFAEAFCKKDAGEWYAELCNTGLFVPERPLDFAARPEEMLHRLQASYYLRNLLNGELDFDRARIVSDDIGFFALSSLGADSDIRDMHFDINNWAPINLFDPLVWFLRRYLS